MRALGCFEVLYEKSEPRKLVREQTHTIFEYFGDLLFLTKYFVVVVVEKPPPPPAPIDTVCTSQ